MKLLHSVVFCCVFAACAEASSVLEVNGHVGGEVSIPCRTANSSSEHDRLYFCKGLCSRENVLIQSERRPSAPAHQGRYSAETDGRDGVFNVTIKNLRSADAGPYYCGVGTASDVLHQYQISLIVQNAPTVPTGPPAFSTNTPRPGADAGLRGGFPSSSEPSAATPASSEEKRNQQGASKLKGTTVVIIVSGSLAFLVCAIIPLIFYGHWRSSPAEDQSRHESKDEGDDSEHHADAASAHVAVGLQSVESKLEPESGAQDSSQYAAIYQALDPKALD